MRLSPMSWVFAAGFALTAASACQDATPEKHRAAAEPAPREDGGRILLPNGDELSLADVEFDPSDGEALGLGPADAPDDLEIYVAEFDDDEAADFDALDAGLTLAASEPLGLAAAPQRPLARGRAATRAAGASKPVRLAQPAAAAPAKTAAAGVARAKSGAAYKVALAKAQAKKKRTVAIVRKPPPGTKKPGKPAPATPAPANPQPTAQPAPIAKPAPAGPTRIVTLCPGIGADATCQNWAGSYFQGCIDQLPAGGTLVLPAGCYLVEKSIVLRDGKKLQGNNAAELRFLNVENGLEMPQVPNASRADGLALTYAAGSFDIFPFVIPAVPPGNAVGLRTPGGGPVANYRVQLDGKDYALFLKDATNVLARAFTTWFVDASGMYLHEEINGVNAPNQMTVDTSPMQFAHRYTFVGDYVWSADMEYAAANTDDDPCRQVYPQTGSVQGYKTQWTSVFSMGLMDLGGELGQQQTLVLHQYDANKPYVQGEYHYFSRGFGDTGWVNRDAQGRVKWGNAEGECADQQHCPNGWAQEIIWNTSAPPRAADLRYKCWR
jgi:hypothetical protein